MTFPDALTPAAVETLEKVLPPRPVTEFEGEEEEPMLEVGVIRRGGLSALIALIIATQDKVSSSLYARLYVIASFIVQYYETLPSAMECIALVSLPLSAWT